MYETFSIKRSFHLLKFCPSPAFKEFSVWGRQTWVPSSKYSHEQLKSQKSHSSVQIINGVLCNYQQVHYMKFYFSCGLHWTYHVNRQNDTIHFLSLFFMNSTVLNSLLVDSQQ